MEEQHSFCLLHTHQAEKAQSSWSPRQKDVSTKIKIMTESQMRRARWKHSRGRVAQQRVISSSDEASGQIRDKQALNHRRINKSGSFQHRRLKSRRFTREPRHLVAHLLTSGKVSKVPGESSLANVLETLTDAWPSQSTLSTGSIETTMKSEIVSKACIAKKERRRSVPEEVIRKFSVHQEKTSESETNVTMPEITPPSSEDPPRVPITVRRKVLERSFQVVDDPKNARSGEEGSSDSDSDAPGLKRFDTIKRAPLRRCAAATSFTKSTDCVERALQTDYNKTGRGIIELAALEKGSQTSYNPCTSPLSETTATAREESDSAVSSDTISSPRMVTQPISSSGNQSSDSEEINCTCLEITSKESSTDPNHSGKSTLSQTRTFKTSSTQDSTMSVNSISSQGSTVTAATDSSSTEMDPKTSAKETSTENDRTPRSPSGRTRSDRDDRKQGKHRNDNGKSTSENCPQQLPKGKICRKENTGKSEGNSMKVTHSCPVQTVPRVYEWSQLSQEEICLIQEQRNKKFQENNRQLHSPLSSSVRFGRNFEVCAKSGSTYQDTMNLDTIQMVPRYSALPRTMSMVVNASSFDANNNSDSDCQSLADSLEDERVPQAYYDTRQESKPVRGGIPPETKTKRHREPRGRAYFVSVDDGGADLMTRISKIPEPPKEIKTKIQERHEQLHKKYEVRVSQQKSIKTELKQEIRKPKKRLRIRRLKRSHPESTEVDIREQKSTIQTKCKESEEKNVGQIKDTPRMPSKIPTPIYPRNNKGQCQNRATEDVTIVNTTETTNQDDLKLSPNQEKNEIDMDALTRHRLSLISSLEATAMKLKAQAAESLKNGVGIRMQTVGKKPVKFRQRFEVIPEERSSSLSSAEDRLSDLSEKRRQSLPVKLVEPETKSGLAEGKSFRRYSLGSLSSYVIAQLMGKPLQAIPCVQRGPNNENKQIIIFSPKDSAGSNSSKGRDALLAMNRVDFERLSKGWMNFYLLKESSGSEREEDEAGITSATDNAIEQQNSDNKTVCQLPSLNKDPPTIATSGSNETNGSVNKSYSLILKQPDIYQLEEYKTPSQEMSQGNEHETYTQNTESSKTLTNSTESWTSLRPKVETKEASTCTERTISRTKKKPVPKLELSAPTKLGSTSTVLIKKKVSPKKQPKTSERACSLPELTMLTAEKPSPQKTQSLLEPMPRAMGMGNGESDSDSDSTVYMNAPSPRLPRLPIEDCACSSDESSSNLEELGGGKSSNRGKPQLPLRRRPLPFRPKHRFGFYESVHGKKPGSGWSVTVEGTIAFPRTRPDLQMRLSFPEEQGPPIVSQSDSGFVEEKNVKTRPTQQNNNVWTVTLKNPLKPVTEGRETHKASCHLPKLGQNQRIKPRGSKTDNGQQLIQEKFYEIWPKVQEVIEKELLSLQLEKCGGGLSDKNPLSVEGRALSIEVKPRTLKLTGRGSTQRSKSTDRSNL